MKHAPTGAIRGSRTTAVAIAATGVFPLLTVSTALGAGLPVAKAVVTKPAVVVVVPAVVVVPVVATPAPALVQSTSTPPTGGTVTSPSSGVIIGPVFFGSTGSTYTAPAAPPPPN